MKKIALIITLLASSFILWAQAPGGFQYQAVIRDTEGSPLVNTSLTVQFSLLEGSESGTSVYSETHDVSTNSFGLINIAIGSGTSTDAFENINWSGGSFFIKTEVDLGSGFQDFGTKQLLSVPFALYGEDADADATNEIQSLTLTGSVLEISEGNSVDLGVLGADTDDQTLTLDGTNLSISEGNTVDLGALQDGTGTDNQALNLTDNELSLEDGGSVDLSSYLDNTDDQTLTLSGSELSIDGGNSVDLGVLGADTDDQTLSLAGTELTISEGNSVDLSGIDTDTNTQLSEAEVDAFVANNGYLTEEVDGSITNEIQDITLEGTNLSISDGSTVDLSGIDTDTNTQLSEAEVDAFVANNGYLTEEVDGSITNEIQDITLEGTNLSISDGSTVDLSGIDTDTNTQLSEAEVDDFVANNGFLTEQSDDQAISLDGNILTLEDGGTVDLSIFLDDTDTNTQLSEQEVDDFVANNGYLTAETDDQAISLDGNILTLEDGGTVDLSAFLDNTDTQLSETEVDNFVANNGYLTAETDDQEISLDGNILTLEDGGTVDLSAFLDDTNTQLSEQEVDDFVANNGYLTEQSDDQAISLDGNILTLEDGGTVDLSAFLDNTDTQLTESEVDAFVANNGYLTEETDDQALTLTSNTLSLEDGGDVDLTPYLDNTDAQNLADVLGNGADANSNAITNLADPTSGKDAATKDYVDNNDLGAFAENSNVISAGDSDDDFVFGSTQLADDNSTFDDNSRMLFDKSKAAFRAGSASADQWDDANVGNNSVGLGIDNTASQYGAVAIGNGNDATASGAIAIGTDVDATTDYAIAIGQYNTASGLNSTALGYTTNASGSNSTTMGNNTLAKSDNELAVGAYNTDYTPAGDDSDRAFVIGNGIDSDNRFDAFTVYKNGNALLDGNLFLDEPTEDTHAATKKYVDDNSSDAQDLSNVLGNGADANATAITNLADPTNAQDAATKAYVDAEISSNTGIGNFEVSETIESLDVNLPNWTAQTSTTDFGQSFTSTKTGILTRVVMGVNSTTGIDATITIFDGEGFGGAQLYTNTFTTSTTSNQTTNIILDQEVSVSAGSVYSIRIQSGSNSLAYSDTSDPYAGGHYYANGSIFSHPSTGIERDLLLSTYVKVTTVGIAVDNDSNVGIGTDSPDASAALEISSTEKGLLIPRMTTAERDAISSPATGLLIYNTDDDEVNKYDGSVWLGELNANNKTITNLSDPVMSQDAATKAYVDSKITVNNDGDFEVNTNPRESVDVTQTDFNTSDVSLTEMAQSFAPTLTGMLTEVTVNLLIPGGGSPTIDITIYSGEGVGGSVLATETFTVNNGSPYRFSSNINVTASNTYTIFIEPTDPANTMTPSISTSNPYPDGVFYRATSSVALNSTSFPNYDAVFSTTVLVPEQTSMFVGEEGVGVGTKTPDESAALEINSTTGGLLLPRLTSSQRDAISSPQAGLIIYNNETNAFQGYVEAIGAATVDANVSNTSGSISPSSGQLGQSFTPSFSGDLSRIDVNRSAITSGSTVTVVIAILEGDGVSGTQLHQQSFTVSPATGTLSFNLDTDVPVLSGQIYTFVIFTSTNFYLSVATDDNVYTGGTGYRSNAIPINKDITFSTYIKPDNSGWVDLH